jgi:hypothetical protein
MALRWTVFLAVCLTFGLSKPCYGRSGRNVACAAFSTDGDLATATLKGDDLETRLDSGGAVVTTHTSVDFMRGCEEAFSEDGKWLATAVPGSELNVIIHDGKTGQLYRRFSSPWRQLKSHTPEWFYQSSFLGGFLQDDSLVLWRYVPRADLANVSAADLHMERWNIQGTLLSDLDLGDVGYASGGSQPLALNGLTMLWLPGRCRPDCFRAVKVSESTIEDTGELTLPDDTAVEPIPLKSGQEFLTVMGEQRTSQKATLLDATGKLQKQVRLPASPNFIGPLVPDWFNVGELQISQDNEFAAIARTRVAWVLVDTGRDWGSEIVILKTGSFTVDTVLKTGKGGIQALAIDHRNGILRLVGFWKGRWHDLKYDGDHPGRWKESQWKEKGADPKPTDPRKKGSTEPQ